MTITNKIFKNHNLAKINDRGENFIIDFVFSSIIPLIIICLINLNIFTSILIYFLTRFVYYFTFEYYFGRTLGKYQTQTIVVNIDNDKPTILQLIKRNSIRFISLVSAIGDDERAIHDKISNTFVVKNKDLKQINFFNKYIKFLFIPFYLYLVYNYLKTNTYFSNIHIIIILVLLIVFLLFKPIYKIIKKYWE